jgi:hypothetical protein
MGWQGWGGFYAVGDTDCPTYISVGISVELFILTYCFHIDQLNRIRNSANLQKLFRAVIRHP